MSFADDDDILQDFLVEAGEILEQLSEQLVDLEQSPDDKDLLNAIFRGFHTVKGGAGFLQLNAMVECCHVTENLFDILRTGKRKVTPELMDVVLQSLDAVNEQYRQVSLREPATPASRELLAQLERLVSGEGSSGDGLAGGDLSHSDLSHNHVDERAAPAPVEDTPIRTADERSDHDASDGSTRQSYSGILDITDDEFESFLDAIADGPVAAPVADNAAASVSDEITDDEFEKLLDQLHGKGKGPGAASGEQGAAASKKPGAPPAVSVGGNINDEITDDEFEALLDQLHGAGRAPGKNQAAPPQETKSPAKAPKPVVPVGNPVGHGANKDADNGAGSADKDAISDDEFEDLLDQLHGKGKRPVQAVTQPAPVKSKIPVAKAPQKSAANATPVVTPRMAEAGKSTEPVKMAAAPAAVAASNAAAAQANENTVRVDTQRLDDIMNMVGELVLVRNRLVRLGSETVDETLAKAVANLDVVTADLQTAVMKTRMQPIKKVFGRFPRVVRDLARNLKKEINLELRGEDTDLDKNLVEALADPLVHLVRNAVDHGIEMPDVREAQGKPRVGSVVLSAEQEGDHILLAISDDGGGMDPYALRNKAVEKGIIDADAAARLNDAEAFNLIFAPGFSTKAEISDVSGRGVGMDVVKTKITQLNGSINVQSKLGEGTRIAIKVPLTLAIMPTLMVMLERQTFALPLVSVNEIFHLDLSTTNVVDGQECVTVREKAIPIFHLKRWLIKKNRIATKPKEGHVVIVSIGTQRVGFVVDQLIGQEEVVIKPLGKMLQGTPGMAGATITGDGTIALILDVPGLLKRYANRT